jgi:hypothetical protein
VTEEDIGTGYIAFMSELKARVDTIVEVVFSINPPSDERELRHNYFLFEGLYLQLRKVCEIIALSMLLVHRMDGTLSAMKLLQEYNAGRLINEITRLNPIGFPRSISEFDGKTDTEEAILELAPVFTAEDIRKLYHQCGDRLHMGSLHQLLSGRTRDLNQDVIKGWAGRFRQGLSNHMVVIPNRRRSFLVTMEERGTGRVVGQFASFTA